MTPQSDFNLEDNIITREEAGHFAHEWIAAWNSHDLPRILAHYSDDFTMSSPGIATVAKEPSGVLAGKQAVGAYWQKALALVPTLRFTLQATFVGADSVAIHYEGVRGPAIEVFFFNEAGLVCRSAAHYL
jgi:ketosteroid isomerase-like protein